MNCKYFRYLLLQLPYDELNEEKIDVLSKHLKDCERCRNELKDNEQLKVFSDILSKSIPSDKKQKESIQQILDGIDPSRFLSTDMRHTGNTAGMKIVFSRTFRIALNVAAIFLIGLFLFQQFEIKRDLKNLQLKIDTQDIMNRQKKLPPTIKEIVNLPDDQVDALIREYEILLKENSAILSYLRINYPEIYREMQQRNSIDSNQILNL